MGSIVSPTCFNQKNQVCQKTQMCQKGCFLFLYVESFSSNFGKCLSFSKYKEDKMGPTPKVWIFIFSPILKWFFFRFLMPAYIFQILHCSYGFRDKQKSVKGSTKGPNPKMITLGVSRIWMRSVFPWTSS